MFMASAMEAGIIDVMLVVARRAREWTRITHRTTEPIDLFPTMQYSNMNAKPQPIDASAP